MNPYTPKSEIQDDEADGKTVSKFHIALGELVIVSAITGFLVALLIPAVRITSERRGGPPATDVLAWLHENYAWVPLVGFPIVFAAVTFLAFALLRKIVPASWLRYIPWWVGRSTPLD